MSEASLPPLECGDRVRRSAIARDPVLHGIDYLEVATEPSALDQRLLLVYFIPKATPEGRASLQTLVRALAREVDKVRLTGGVRVLDVRVTRVVAVDDHLEVYVDRPGDFSRYLLRIDSPETIAVEDRPPGFDGEARMDPAFAEVDFTFKAGCPSRFDCAPRPAADAPSGPEPVIDYMVKDFASFRQALLDFAAERVPEWTERHEADLGVTLVELLAYAGDQLSYHQDAVAGEAYLETARKRISVRRHARLIDYEMHDGASARTFVHVAVDPQYPRRKPGDPQPPVRHERHPEGQLLPAGTAVLSRVEQPPARGGGLYPTVISGGTFGAGTVAMTRADAVFETLADAHLSHRLNEIRVHTWGNRDCCLPEGATSADLLGDLTRAVPRVGRSWGLSAGDFLLFEEIRDPTTGLAVDADPMHRQIVRVVDVSNTRDPLEDDHLLTRVQWDAADALRFRLCLNMVPVTPGSDRLVPAGVARGNLVLADHGRDITEVQRSALRPAVRTRPRGARLKLAEGPLSYQLPLPETGAAVVDMLRTDPRSAAPRIQAARVRSGGQASNWAVAGGDLLDTGPFDREFAVEVDDDGRGVLRFGDGELGMALPDDADMDISYRVGIGAVGNVGPDALSHVIAPDAGGESGRLGLTPSVPPWSTIREVRNPLPAWGGAEPEGIEQVRRLAPAAFRAGRMFAVTEDDYARAAEQHPSVSHAAATFRWTGSWLTVFVTIDPVGRVDLTPELDASVRDHVRGFAQAGYDIEVDAPTPIPLDVAVEVCVSARHFRADVEVALLEALGSGVQTDGSRGLFHPDNFTFGQALYLSQVYSAAEAVAGVEFVTVQRFQRYAKAPAGELEAGVIEVGRLEVVRLDNDPNRPENGVLELRVRGGK